MSGHIILTLLGFACISCKVDFDFSDLKSDPILYLDMDLRYDASSYNGENTQAEMPLSLDGFIYAVPSAAGEREFQEDLRCRMDLYHNSELAFTYDDIKLHEFHGLLAGQVFGLVPGDELTVVAQAEGFPTARSTVVFPDSPPQLTISHSRINSMTFRIGMTLEDDPLTEDCYAFTFTKAYWSEGSLVPSGVSQLEPSFGNADETGLLDIGPFEVIWEDGVKYYGISDRTFNGKQKTIELNVDYPLMGDGMDQKSYYSIGLYRISPERMKYITACQNKENNILGFIGLAPATFAYTNVIGGTGCVSCTSYFETDWIPVPPLE